MKKIGFVAPWYGEKIPGGAEMELRGLIHHLQDAGVELEVLTTCIKDFMCNWNDNFHKPGDYVEAGISIKRFKVRRGNHDIFGRINNKLLHNVTPSLAEEHAFIEEIVRSTDLEEYIKNHAEEYSLFIYIPYMFGTTYHGVMACPQKAVIIPCLHDENYAYMSVYKKCFEKSRGMIFHAKPESILAHKLYRLDKVKNAVLGEGVDTDLSGNSERFREKYGINEPFILYAGRKDKTKNVDLLVRYFERYKKENLSDLQLVMIGPAQIDIPTSICADVHDLGFVPLQDKYDAYTAAHMLCQPSKNESFSLVIMESWLAGRPVLVSTECAVTANFAEESNGGFHFNDYYQFEAQVNYLLENPDIATRMGTQGREYVISNFSWDVIVDKYMRFFKECMK